jgi:hypothetical protein
MPFSSIEKRIFMEIRKTLKKNYYNRLRQLMEEKKSGRRERLRIARKLWKASIFLRHI